MRALFPALAGTGERGQNGQDGTAHPGRPGLKTNQAWTPAGARRNVPDGGRGDDRMRQLSGTDSLFLRLERGNQHMHVAGLGIYDPSTAPDGRVRFKDVLGFFQARLDTLPFFRRRLVTVPFGLDRPYWIEDPDIDVEFHVRHIALPHRATGASCASRSRAFIRGRSIAASRCGRPTSSRASTTSRDCRPAVSRCT